MSIPTDSTPRREFRFGFFAAVGAVCLLVLAWLGLQVLAAVMEIAAPFVIGLGLALLLDPLVHKLQQRGLGRMAAAGIVTGISLVVLIAGGSLMIPAIAGEASDLATNGPGYLDTVRGHVNEFLAHHHRLAGISLPKNFDILLANVTARISDYLSQSSGQLVGYVMGSVTFLIDSVVMLIVTFYFLVDLDRLRARLLYLIPGRNRGLATRTGRDVGQVFADYLRGLLIVCVLFGASTTVLLYVLSLFHHTVAKYALLVGVLAAILYVIPYLGALTVAILAFLVAYAGGGFTFGLVALAGVVVVEQIYDNVVTPKIVGGGVGLHPVLALFALVLGGHLFGLWGLLLSVPVVASIQVILFRLFPKLTTPTPSEFLQQKDVPADEGESAKVMAGEDSVTQKRKLGEKKRRDAGAGSS